MFREIGLQSSERDLHRFLLADEHDQLQDYRMMRLTFGVSSSPFMATRVLLQLANDYEQEYPRAAQIIRHSFYVDDCLMGADSEKDAQDLQQEVTNLVSKGKMTLRKWRSSSQEVLTSRLSLLNCERKSPLL